VSVTIPCVAGPYTSVPCKLTLLANRTRVDPRPGTQYGITGPDDQRFEFNFGSIRSIVTSTARDDSGTFESPTLRDERYLPFEGAGVISSWRLELPPDFPPFDYRTITDFILTIRYTSRDGGDILRDLASKKLGDALKNMQVQTGRTGLIHGFSGRHEFVDAWQAFAYMPDTQAGDQVLSFPISADRFPAFTGLKPLKINRVLMALIPSPGIAYDDSDRVQVTVTPPTGAAFGLTLKTQLNRAGGLPVDEAALLAPVNVVASADPPPKPWKIDVTHVSDNLARTVSIGGADVSRIDPAKVNDVAILFSYSI
jgi:hypothetical protein